MKHERGAKHAWQQGRGEGTEDISSAEFENSRNRTKSRRWNSELPEVYKCDAEGCHNKHLQLKTTQLFFEVVHEVEGGRTRAMCLDCKKDLVFGKETSPGTLRLVQAQKTAAYCKT